MKKLVLGIVTSVAIFGAVVISQVDAYQTCDTALQVTFKNGVNFYVDTQEKVIDLYK